MFEKKQSKKMELNEVTKKKIRNLVADQVRVMYMICMQYQSETGKELPISSASIILSKEIAKVMNDPTFNPEHF